MLGVVPPNLKSFPASSYRVLLGAMGSLGDLHPVIALAHELRNRGHQPVIATSPQYEQLVREWNLDFRPVRPEVAPPEVMAKTVETGTGYLIREWLLPALRQSFDDTAAAFEGMDFMVSHPLTYAFPLLAQKQNIPWASLVLAPMGFYSAHDLPVFENVPAHAHRADLSIRRQIVTAVKKEIRSWGGPLHDLRRQLGLPFFADALIDSHSPELVLAMFSAQLAPKQPDWPRESQITGYSFAPAHDLDPAVLRFLDSGPPPIVFTLGTMVVWQARDFYNESAIVARRLGFRAVLLTGNNPRNRLASPIEGLLEITYAPFAPLFARAAAVVHHGGIGALSDAMRAGKPMLIVPGAGDQPDNAARAERLGIARVVALRDYSKSRSERELRILMNSEQYARRAESIARDVSVENGAVGACDTLERWFAGRSAVRRCSPLN